MMMMRPAIYSNKSQGFAMMSAIFILVVLAALGAAMMSISSSQHRNAALDMQGARVYQAARAGVEWGVHRIANAADPANACFASPSSFTPSANTLNAFTVHVTCNRIQSSDVTVYVLRSTACNFPNPGPPASCPGASTNPGYVERVLEVTL
jgi:MSHA biogenesis protein MshP